MKIDVILWDYDGTMVNSVSKNISITKEILSKVAPRFKGENLPKYLKTEEAYHMANHESKNWQDLYLNYYGLTEKEMREAGSMWTEYQLKNSTPVELYGSIKEVINQIKQPQGICSQNSSENINRVLKKYHVREKFSSIIGYDDIPSGNQKPHAYGGIECLREIFEKLENKTIIYIGDHEVDVEFARNIEREISQNSKVISIIGKYSGANTGTWTYQPDIEIEDPIDLLKII